MTHKNTFLLATNILTLITALAACGTDDDGTTTKPPALVPDATAAQPHPFGSDASAGEQDAAPIDPGTPDATRPVDPPDAAADASPPPPPPVDAGADENLCAQAGGICVGRAANCTSGGGTVASSGAPGCVFSDGPGVCCIPPQAQPEGDTCASRGGVCAPIAGCNFVHGSFGPSGCTGVGIVCCLPKKTCGEETQVCCEPGGSATFRPACDRGNWVCTISGTRLQPPSACP